MEKTNWEERFNEEFPGKVNEACLSKKDVRAFIRTTVREAELNTTLEVVSGLSGDLDAIKIKAALSAFDEAEGIIAGYIGWCEKSGSGIDKNQLHLKLKKRRAELAEPAAQVPTSGGEEKC